MPLHLKRQREILEILSANGFGILAAASGLDRAWPSRHVVHALTPRQHRVDEALRSPAIVLRTIEELGPTFVKFGQILSTRPDLVPPDYQEQLAKLRTAVPPEPFAHVRQTVEQELGAPLEELFVAFDAEPLGSASIGQTHAAVLPDGRNVVVKVMRQGVEEQLRIDIDIMRRFAQRIEKSWAVARDLDLAGFVEEFDRQIAGELDYTREGHNAERIGANFADRSGLTVPGIIWEFSTSRVLTMEHLRGIPIDDIEALDAAGIDRAALGRRAATFILDMVLVDGFFHGDPHPGNLLVGPSGSIELLDYGMVGTLSDAHRRQLIGLVAAFAARDADRLADSVLELAPPSGRVDRRTLNRALARLIEHYADRPLAEVPIVSVVNELLEIVRSQRLRPQPELAMVIKMLTMVEGLGRVLDPAFDMMGLLKPYGAKLLRQQFEPDALMRSLLSLASDASAFGVELPEQARRILRRYEQEGLHLALDDATLHGALRRVETVGDRLVASIVLAALINAAAVLGASDQRWLAKARRPLLIAGSASAAGLAGFLTAARRRRR